MLFQEDVHVMAEIGFDAYRFSISWSRLIPNAWGPVNPKGLQYYKKLINELISHGIQPHVTLDNYDLPRHLKMNMEDGLTEGLCTAIYFFQNDFTTYADVCFREFGDMGFILYIVNEPEVFAVGGYDEGIVPHRHCSPPFGINCTRGNSSSEPYIAVHNILLAHLSAARLYKKTYQLHLSPALYFRIVNPLVLLFGDYPDTMKKIAGSRIPTFTYHESELVRGSFDFIGLCTQLPILPWGLQAVLKYFKQVYGNPLIYILENGLYLYLSRTH
ncbi:hypothetical protein CRYUN_Cryun14cG0086900 [Craigia yunnanensis]